MSEKRYAIYGAGSLGTVLGAYIEKSGGKIDLVNRNRAHVQALKEHGARITGTAEMTVPVTALLPDEMQGQYDIILLMTKQQNNPEVVSALKPHLKDDGVLVTLQNGLPEPGIADILGAHRTMGCTVEWGATLSEPGVCVLTSDPDSLSFHMGGMEGIPQARFEEVKALLERMCPVHVEENLLGARWSKLLINATFSGLGTVIGGTFGDVANDQKVRRIAQACINEVIDVGHAAGAVFAPVQGMDITKLFYAKNPVKRVLSSLIIPIAMKKHRAIEPSMLQDLKKGKACEVDAINGVVCEWGRKCGVKTPVNDRIVQLIHEAQEGRLALNKDNAARFADLI